MKHTDAFYHLDVSALIVLDNKLMHIGSMLSASDVKFQIKNGDPNGWTNVMELGT